MSLLCSNLLVAAYFYPNKSQNIFSDLQSPIWSCPGTTLISPFIILLPTYSIPVFLFSHCFLHITSIPLLQGLCTDMNVLHKCIHGSPHQCFWVCSDVIFSVNPSLTTWFKIAIPCPHWHPHSQSLCSALFIYFWPHTTYHILNTLNSINYLFALYCSSSHFCSLNSSTSSRLWHILGFNQYYWIIMKTSYMIIFNY